MGGFYKANTVKARQQVVLTAPLYERREKTISQIPNFWPLVLEQAPPDIDQYIQPSDSAVLLSSLKSLKVTHFELDTEPRSIAITFEFKANNHFEDTKLEKKFWYRKAKGDWSGLVSEPVKIQWKDGHDLTGGLLDLVCKEWESRGKNGSEETPEQKALMKKIQSTGMGGLSFFAWFGFIGPHITAEESAEATKVQKSKRLARQQDKKDEVSEDAEEDESPMDTMGLEIFPEGDEVAVAISEDLWPGAIRYFSKSSKLLENTAQALIFAAAAQELEGLSDEDFESDSREYSPGGKYWINGEDSDDEAGPPAKKQRGAL